MELHRVARHPGRRGRGEVLGRQGLGGGPWVADLPEVAGRQAEEAGGADADDHVGEAGPDELVVADRHAELLPALGVPEAGVEAGLGDPHGAPRHAVPAEVEAGGGDVGEAEARPAHQAAPRDPAALQVELGEQGGAGADETAERDAGEAGGVAVHEEGDDALAAAGEDQEEIGDLAEGDPLLDPVEDPVVALAAGLGPDVLGVAPHLGLRQGEGPEALGRGEERELLGPQLAAPPPAHGLPHHVVDREQRADRGAAPPQLLGEQPVAHRVEAAAAHRPRQERAQPPSLAEGLDDLGRHRLLPVPRPGVGRDPLGDEGARRRPEPALLRRKLEPRSGLDGDLGAGRRGPEVNGHRPPSWPRPGPSCARSGRPCSPGSGSCPGPGPRPRP